MAPIFPRLDSFKCFDNQSDNDPFADDQTGIDTGSFSGDVGDIPLQNVKKGPTETVHRMDSEQSTSSNTIQSIYNGVDICSVCQKLITAESIARDGLWNCHNCDTVCHFLCLSGWAQGNYLSAQPDPNDYSRKWRCPGCTVNRSSQLPLPTCWCGKQYFDPKHERLRGNSCSNVCGISQACEHGLDKIPCDKICHPGKCNSQCQPKCDDLLAIPEIPTAWGRFRKAWPEVDRKVRRHFIIPSVILLLFNIAFPFFFVYNLKRITQPYKYHWSDDKMSTYVGVMRSAELVVAIVLILIWLWYTVEFNYLARSLRKLTKRPGPQDDLWFFFITLRGFLLTIMLPLAFILWYFIGVFGAPEIVWYHQMKNSCNGFNRRIDMDYSSLKTPGQVFKPNSIVAGHEIPQAPAYLGTHFDPKINSKDPWQEYQVLSGGTEENGYYEVAVDLQNYLWAFKHTTGPNIENMWLTTDRRILDKERVNGSTKYQVPRLPEFPKVDKSLISNGTFSKVLGFGTNAKDMYFPEAGLLIQNMKDFVDDCQQEPFIRVFNTYGKSKFEVQEMALRKWSNKNDKSIVMRTASFGHGRQALDMCIREGEIIGDMAGDERRAGVSERLIVPFAVMAAYRMRVVETGLRDRCSIY